MNEKSNSATELMSDYRQKTKATQMSGQLVEALSKYIPEACRWQAIRCMELYLIENKIEFMDEYVKTKLEYYQKMTLEVSHLELASIYTRDSKS